VCSALIVLLLFVSFQTILPARMAQAQDAAEPILTITGVDPSQLPLIRVTAYGANLKNALAELPITLTEDNVEQPILDSRRAGRHSVRSSNNATGSWLTPPNVFALPSCQQRQIGWPPTL
jgi:hypothetical protein